MGLLLFDVVFLVLKMSSLISGIIFKLIGDTMKLSTTGIKSTQTYFL
jgi:hypothetical protein